MPDGTTRREWLAGGLTFAAAALSDPGGCLAKAKAAAKKKSTPAEPQIIARREWNTSKINRKKTTALEGIECITVHHTAVVAAHVRERDDVIRMLKGIRDSHVGRGWADIGYHFAIDPAGHIWEARSIEFQGAHVRGQNEHNLGIVLLGDFEKETPTREALASLDKLLLHRMHRYKVTAGKVHTHRELAATLCPGKSLQKHMIAARAAAGALHATV